MNSWKHRFSSPYKIAAGLAIAVAAGCSAGGTASTGDTSGAGGDTTTSTTGMPASSTIAVGSGGSGACPNVNSVNVATHITMDVTWPGTVGIEPGAGQVNIWTLGTQDYNGGNFTGMGRACGSTIPDLMGTPIVGGKQIGNDFPPTVWDSPSMPVIPLSGTSSGFEVGASLVVNKTVNLIGATMVNPEFDPWPMSYTGLMAVDHDGDGKVGITAITKTGGNFQEPPVNLLMTARADLLYLATRSILTLTGTRDSCNSVTGTAMIEKFDNHVVGCHILGGGECAPPDVQFVDDNRTIFAIGSATFRSVSMPPGATCADARAALP